MPFPRRTLARAAMLAPLFLVLALGAGPADRPQVVRAVADREARQPQVAVSPDGRVFLAFGVGDEIRCVCSDDGGRTFSEPVRVGSPGVMALGMRRGPRIASTAGSVVIAAIGGRVGKGRDGDVWAWRSADGGERWSDPVRVNDVEGSAREGLHALAAGPDGRFFCAWIDLRDDRAEVRGASSTDGGATWSENVLVHRSPIGPICPCCHPSAAFGPDGTLYVMWRDAIDGSRDMYLSRSADGGETFGPAEKLGQGTWPLETCPMDGGAIAPGPDGLVLTAWMRDGRFYAAEPGRSERLLGPGVQGWAAWGAGGPSIVWLDRRPGRLLALRPGDEEPIELSRSANDPTVASPVGALGPVVVSWESGPGGTGIFSARLDRGSNDPGGR
ncbi:sialidase family protein [Tautonia sociabilis]|uniref:Exo-alpha-sialidase n=1 Tax=Tautonia sociabilis TaxID=2080755 RepID=A0A432MMF7_9BACT|nr:exo-alpha-sialidase [Tautonia sociabilis]RUL88258.1 exo-alpha-sialidase [Tautonia sociabilis]